MRLLLLLGFVAHASAEADDVVVLHDHTFDEFLESHSHVLVEFYAPWCGHCKALDPEYKIAATNLKEYGADTVLAKVDATQEIAVASKFEVTGYPTLKYFIAGEPVEYGGGRTAPLIESWIKKKELPILSTFEEFDKLQRFVKKHRLVAIGYYVEGSAAANALNRIANDDDDKLKNIVFGHVTDPDFSKKMGATIPSLVLYRENDRPASDRTFAAPEVTFADSASAASIVEFLENESFPPLAELTKANFQEYNQRGLPLAWVATDPYDKEDTKHILDMIRPHAIRFKGRVSFVYVDGLQFAGTVENKGIVGVPGMVIEDNKNNEKYLFEGEFDGQTLKDWFDMYDNGDLPLYMKSEDPPENNFGAVKTIVGKTWTDEVVDSPADVLLEYYAPWCGHCKRLAPEYEKVGNNFRANSNVVIAKIDATANDTPEKITGFPTLIFYPGDGSEARNYNGDRSARAITNWIKQQATNKGEL